MLWPGIPLRIASRDLRRFIARNPNQARVPFAVHGCVTCLRSPGRGTSPDQRGYDDSSSHFQEFLSAKPRNNVPTVREDFVAPRRIALASSSMSLKVTSPVPRLMISGCTLDQISGVSVLNFIRQRQGILKMPDQLTHLSASSIIPEVPPSGRIGRHLDRIEYRRVIILGLVNPRRDRPNPHELGRERTHQVARVGLFAEPAA